MAPKRNYEVGESSKPRAITAEAKARRQAYLKMWNNLRNLDREEPKNPISPPTLEESDSTTTLVPPSAELPQSLNDDSKAKTKEGFIITSTGERAPFKWGKCIGIGPYPEEEEKEEDSEEGDLEMDPEDTPIGEQQEDAEESEEDPEENFEEKAEELEEEEEVEIMEEDIEEEWEPMEFGEDEDPWEIPSGDEEILDENLDKGNVDEPEAIERTPKEREVSDSEYKGFSSDDNLC